MNTPHLTDGDIRELLRKYPTSGKASDGEDQPKKKEEQKVEQSQADLHSLEANANLKRSLEKMLRVMDTMDH